MALSEKSPSVTQRPGKLCFVTIGATAPFDSLLTAILSPPFFQALREAGYTDLLIQYGKEGKKIFDEAVSQYPPKSSQVHGLKIAGFDFNRSGLGQEMRAAKGDDHPDSVEGAVISHAGSGSILDALRVGVPLIVVPNTDLLHNHQLELAEELATQGYVVHGKLANLAAAVQEAETLRRRKNEWPPVNSGDKAQQRGLAGVMDDEMGWVD